MEKIVGIKINEIAHEVIFLYANKEKKSIKIEDEKLYLMLRELKEKYLSEQKDIGKKNQKYKFWHNMLRGSIVLFSISFGYIFFDVAAANIPKLYPLFSLIPLSISYIEHNYYYNLKENNIIRENKILNNIEKIDRIDELRKDLMLERRMEETKTYERQRKADLIMNRQYQHQIRITKITEYIQKIMEMGEKLVLIFNPVREHLSQSNVKINTKSIVQRAIEEGEELQYLRNINNQKMDGIERKLEDFKRSGRR